MPTAKANLDAAYNDDVVGYTQDGEAYCLTCWRDPDDDDETAPVHRDQADEAVDLACGICGHPLHEGGEHS